MQAKTLYDIYRVQFRHGICFHIEGLQEDAETAAIAWQQDYCQYIADKEKAAGEDRAEQIELRVLAAGNGIEHAKLEGRVERLTKKEVEGVKIRTQKWLGPPEIRKVRTAEDRIRYRHSILPRLEDAMSNAQSFLKTLPEHRALSHKIDKFLSSL